MPTNARPAGDGPTRWLRVSILLLAAFAALAVLSAPTAAQSADDSVVVTNDTTVSDDLIESQPPAPAEDRLGWEDGVWYNATLAVDQSDGIQSEELRALIARTMARTEYVRGLEFDRTPPVRVISREQAENESSEVAALNESERLLLNAQYEALFMIPEQTDAIESREALLGSGIGGYYAPGSQSITMVSPEGENLRVQENTLSQELFHAQQDQQFVLDTNAKTIEDRNAYRSVVEGDANYVQYRYEQRCAEAWNGTCYIPSSDEQPGSADLPSELNLGMLQTFLQPYSSGVAFVRDRQQAGGWDAVDALYENPPESTEQVIHPETYPDEEPANLTVPDRSSEAWQPLTADGERVTGSVGEAGLFVSLWYPSFETQGLAARGTNLIPVNAHINIDSETGELAQPVTYSYEHNATAGWAGDKLLPYTSADNGSLEDLGYVYETAWDSPGDAEEFEAAYRDLLTYNDAEAVADHENTYRLPEDSDFADAVYVNRTGQTVRIVNAPSVDALSQIRAGAAPDVAGNGTDETNGTDNTDATATETPDSDDGNGSDSDGESGPGFGVLAAALAVAVVTALAVRARQ